MLKIAVCDDDAEDLKKIETSLETYFASRLDRAGEAVFFADSSSLLRETSVQNGFDLYLLDILMPEPDGIETARKLRELGHSGEIIYLTCSNDFAADSYDVRAFFYLLKPVDESRLFEVLDAASEKRNCRRDSSLILSTPGGPRRIPFERIRYVERAGRIMRCYCTDGILDSRTIRCSLREMAAPLLRDPRFFLCGASFIFNFQHITGVNGQTALLDDGSSVPLPRTCAAAFKRAWGNYWLREETDWLAPGGNRLAGSGTL